MNFLADESVDFPIVAKLRQDGHAVVTQKPNPSSLEKNTGKGARGFP